MSQNVTLPDPLVFARDADSLCGEFGSGDFSRLSASVLELGAVRWRVSGACLEDGRAALDVSAQGVAVLRCERCLGPLDWAFAVARRLSLYRADEDIPEEELEDESCDAIHFAGALDVAGLVEDEILLELPVFARHEACEPPGPWEAGEALSPFAVLAQLKRS
ncbi:MAG: YceD family protein [Tepidiphilus sp.]|jgi:uncharacterized protein|uniref:YceD family protein n=1 Tax=Tepidiphilus sp. J10 TaxID=2502185 RepID=UPI00115E1580|nr:YceD family protein [Tepidiphilus sp. J10]MDD2407268.1 YceD family protein [Tepidiphilus sp.]MDD3432610.1 YceD family protein [Tepidiphilus sp.]